MKLALLILASLIANVRSEGFSYSSGWEPGQTVSSQWSAPTGSVEPGTSSGVQLSWSSLLTSDFVSGLFARSGINITQKLEEAQRKAADLPWDKRIPMIRDDNFEELIINESFTSREEEESRLWFLLVTVTSSQRAGVSAVIDEQFNEAYNITINEQDLPSVRWGRIDYLNVTRLTTKWAVWRAPMLIVAKDNGKTLRFFHPQQIGVRASQLRDFLLHEYWQRREPWSGPWAPGGSREEILDKFATLQEIIYFYMVKIPRWMYFVISGAFGSFFIQLMHRKPKPSEKKSQAVPPPAVEQQEDVPPETVPPNVETKKTGSRKRKGSKR